MAHKKSTPGTTHPEKKNTELPVEEQAASNVQPIDSAPPRRARKPKAEEPEIHISEELMSNPDKLNFVLLAALLAKSKKPVLFSQDDLDIDDGAVNIVFAKTSDNKNVVVQLVSSESGIIKTPEKKGATWPISDPLQYRPLPTNTAQQFPGEGAGPMPAVRMMEAAAPPPDAAERVQQQRKAEQPNPFPFQVGDRPETAATFDLGNYANNAELRADRRVQEEQAALSRPESQ